MRLLRVGEPGRERPCVRREDGTVVDVSSLVDDFDGGFLAGGGVERLRAEMSSRTDLPVVDVDAERIGPCVARPPKVVCIGLNYVDHAEESGQPVPTITCWPAARSVADQAGSSAEFLAPHTGSDATRSAGTGTE